jgi:DNA-binding IscR family transcriptional regulator
VFSHGEEHSFFSFVCRELEAMRNNLYVKILAKMDARLKNAFSETKTRLAPKTLIELAKQFGYIEGIRGQGGGYITTDKGLEYLGLNVDEFIEKENKAKMETLEDTRRRQKEASIQRAYELDQMVKAAQKEFVNETATQTSSGGSKRSQKDSAKHE